MYTHIIDRSNLDDVVAITEDGIKITRREDLAHHTFHRADIVLLNCTRSKKEYILEVTADGFTGDMFILDILSDEQYEQVNNIAICLRDNAINYPPAAKLIR